VVIKAEEEKVLVDVMQTKKKNHKYIFVIGGVMSGVGKGIATASIGTILESMKYKVNLMKMFLIMI
jgi:dethiobiotin synthetase